MEPLFTPLELRVDLLPRSALALPGRLGLTHAPGRWSPGRHTDSDVRLREDLEIIARDHGARMLVTLVERNELVQLGNLRREARRAGLRWLHFPIPDMWIPSDVAATRRLVDRMLDALERGENVVVHCWGGLGRAGTIAACCLVAHGCEPRRAIALVRSARPGAVQSIQQELFVRQFAATEER
jgi:ADP-ribosyl-[dinitrogen reductase] hydrolase